MTHAIVQAARGWVGTRFQHQGRLRAASSHRGGCDCLGLLIGVARELKLRAQTGLMLADYDERAYGHYPEAARLEAVLDEALRRVDAPAPGDVALMRIDANAQHLGIISDYPGGGLGLIHAFAPARAVVEHRLDAQWRARIVRTYRTAE